MGVSGWEKKLNEQLRGQDGYFKVELDENGDWIDGTWEEIQSPKCGYDAYLPFSVDDTTSSVY